MLESQSQITGVIDARGEGHGLIKRCTRQFTGTDGPEGSCNTSAKGARQSSALSNWRCTCFNRTKAHSSRQRSGTNSKASPLQHRWRAGSKDGGRGRSARYSLSRAEVPSTKTSGWDLAAAGIASATAIGLNFGSQIGEMALGQHRAPVASAIHSAHLGVAHLWLDQEASLFLHAGGCGWQATAGPHRFHPRAPASSVMAFHSLPADLMMPS